MTPFQKTSSDSEIDDEILDSDAVLGCGGGLMALDGLNGNVLWSLYTKHEIFAVNCNLDITGDGTKDCICGGRMAVSTLCQMNSSILSDERKNQGIREKKR